MIHNPEDTLPRSVGNRTRPVLEESFGVYTVYLDSEICGVSDYAIGYDEVSWDMLEAKAQRGRAVNTMSLFWYLPIIPISPDNPRGTVGFP